MAMERQRRRPVMKLVGQYDSPFVRRTAIALHHHGIAFERVVLSVFRDFEAMLEINPLGKVPTLLLPDGQALFDSKAIIEYLDAEAPEDRRLTPLVPAERVRMLQFEAVGIGLAEKIVEFNVETSRRTPGTSDPAWTARLERQIGSALAWLDSRMVSDFLVGGRLTRADLAVAVAATFLINRQPQLYGDGRYPALEAHRTACETLSVFHAAAYSAAAAAATAGPPAPT
jgi:glutathione S-transferase